MAGNCGTFRIFGHRGNSDYRNMLNSKKKDESLSENTTTEKTNFIFDWFKRTFSCFFKKRAIPNSISQQVRSLTNSNTLSTELTHSEKRTVLAFIGNQRNALNNTTVQKWIDDFAKVKTLEDMRQWKKDNDLNNQIKEYPRLPHSCYDYWDNPSSASDRLTEIWKVTS